MATDKRARKKEHRDAVLAQREAQLRKRRAARVFAIGLVLALIVGAAVFAGGGSGDDEKDSAAGGDTPPTASAEPEPGGVACGAEKPEQSGSQKYKQAEQVLEDGVDYRAVMETSCGTIEIDLLEDEAPITVNNFVFLSQEGFYDGLTFHRIEPSFVIQGGDPEGTGAGGPGYQFEDELWMKPKEYTFGTMAMANAGPDTNGSQFFFITHEPKGQEAGLPAAYTVFGRADDASFETIEAIAGVQTLGPNAPDPSQASRPVETVYIETVEIIEG